MSPSRCAPTTAAKAARSRSLSLIARNLGDKKWTARLVMLGVLATCLFYGDAMITPAISVLSAVEGLTIVEAALAAARHPDRDRHPDRPVPGPVARHGQGRRHLRAGDPGLFRGARRAWRDQHHAPIPTSSARSTRIWAVKFFLYNPKLAFLALGSVFLAVTGAETLYADMGHFGRKAIGFSWLTLVYPCLMLNYLGQGALLLGNPAAVAESLLPDGAGLGAAAAGRHRHRGDDHRQPGGDFGRLLGHPPGGPARLPAAPEDRAHQRESGRADLHPGGQLGPAGDGHPAGAGLPRIRPAWRRPMASR